MSAKMARQRNGLRIVNYLFFPACAFIVGLALFLPGTEAFAALAGSVSISTTQTSAPYTYHMTVHNTGTVAIDQFWFAWFDFPVNPNYYDVNFMPIEPSSIANVPNWYAYETNNGPDDGFGIDYYPRSLGIAPGQSVSGFDFVSDMAPSAFSALVNVPGYGNFPISTSFLFAGEDSIQLNAQFVPEPSSFVLAALSSLAGGAWWWCRKRRTGISQ